LIHPQEFDATDGEIMLLACESDKRTRHVEFGCATRARGNIPPSLEI
jgi:hypothetical protein